MKQLNLSKWISERDIIAMLFACLIGITISGHSDYLLITHYYYNNAPYGQIWVWLNPQFWTQTFYKWYTFFFTVIWLIPQAVAVKKGKMNIRMFELFLGTTIWYRFLTAYQETTMTAVAPLASLYPIFSIFMILMRLPFRTFPPTASDPDFQCALGNCVAFNANRTLYFGLFHSATPVYISQIIWLVLPLYVWRKNKKGWKPGEQEKFWRKWTLIFIALFAFGFLAQLLDLWFYRGIDVFDPNHWTWWQS